MKTAVQVVRVLVGVLFIVSGLIKVNDPWGLAYKMDEYFAVWHWDWATPYSLALSIAMNCFEVVAGVALLLGWASGAVTRLLLALILFFTFLTGYAVLSGKIKTCGCFGDCIPLEAWQSFVKDLILLALILFLLRYASWIRPVANLRATLFLLLLSLGFSFWGQLNVLKHLPYKDCLPYASGKNLVEQMKPPPGSVPDSVAIFFTYNHQGKEISFGADAFPDDFNEESYTFVRREEKVVRKGNAVPAIQDFALFSATGADTTQAILAQQGHYLLVFARNFEGNEPGWMSLFTKIVMKAGETGTPVYLITNQPVAARDFFTRKNKFNIPVLTCDGTVMKTFLRTTTGVVAMEGAVVRKKLAEADMNDIIRHLNALKQP